MMDMFEPNRLSVLDVENIRLHYAKTLECWLRALRRERRRRARACSTRRSCARGACISVGSIAAFLAGRLQLFQVLYARTGAKNVPWTRAHVYTRPPLSSYAEKTARLTSNWQSGSGPLGSQKSTISNLFRYQPRGAAARRLSLGEFNHVLALDAKARTVEVEGPHDLRDRRRALPGARLPAARRARAQAHHRRRRHRRHRHRVDLLPLRLRARRPARGRRAAARAARSSRRAPTTSTPISSARCRTPTARSATSCARRSRCTRPRPYVHLHVQKLRRRRRRISKRCASRPQSPDLQFVEGLFFEDGRYFLMTGRFVDAGARVRRHRAQERLLPARRDSAATSI